MELVELGEVEINPGAPCPTIISNDNHLYLIFYKDVERNVLKEREGSDAGVFVMKFLRPVQYSFGLPNNESIQGHPYYRLGMRSNSFYRLDNSMWINQLMQIEKAHPYFDKGKWKEVKHYILTFHDNQFECLARGYEVRFEDTSLYAAAVSIIQDTLD